MIFIIFIFYKSCLKQFGNLNLKRKIKKLLYIFSNTYYLSDTFSVMFCKGKYLEFKIIVTFLVQYLHVNCHRILKIPWQGVR